MYNNIHKFQTSHMLRTDLQSWLARFKASQQFNCAIYAVVYLRDIDKIKRMENVFSSRFPKELYGKYAPDSAIRCVTSWLWRAI